MNSIFAKRRARLLAMKAIRDNYIPGDKLVTCPHCQQESEFLRALPTEDVKRV